MFYSTSISLINEKPMVKSDKGDKSLEVWGTNLGSTVGEKLKKLAMVQLAPYQKSIMIGILLSDGWLRMLGRANATLALAQSGDNREYLWFVYLN